MHHRLKVLEEQAMKRGITQQWRAFFANYARGKFPPHTTPVQKPMGPDVGLGAKQWSAPRSRSE